MNIKENRENCSLPLWPIGMGISSANLNELYKTIKKAGWSGEDKVGHHVTLSIITGEHWNTSRSPSQVRSEGFCI